MSDLLTIKDVSFSYDGIAAVNRFSASIPAGSLVGLIGPNGAGKTTLFNLISSFIPLAEGDIRYNERSLKGWPPYKVAAAGIARTFQDLRLISRITVLENLLLANPRQPGEAFMGVLFRPGQNVLAERKNRQQAEEILAFIGLEEKRNNLASDLSYGQQKLLTLGCGLATGANLLLLDEPVSGIHPDMIEKILALLQELKSRGKTILFIEHNIEAVSRVADTVIVMDEGQKIAEGPPALVLKQPEILEAYLE